MLHSNKIDACGRKVLAATCLSIGILGLGPTAAFSQGGPAETAAVAGVVIEVIGGLSSWLEKNSDDCAVAAMAAAWGKDCSMTKEECTDTGLYNAYCSAPAENACGYGRGSGRAYESVVGMWGGYEIDPYAKAWAKPLHNNQDAHGASAWGKAQVDGTSRAKSEETPPSRPGGEQDLLADRSDASDRRSNVENRRARTADAAAGGAYPEGAVVAVAFFDTLRLSANGGSPVGSWIRAKFEVTELFQWETFVQIEGDGTLTTTGGIPASSFSVAFDPVADRWNVALVDFRVEFAVDTLETAVSVDSIDVSVHLEVELVAGDANATAFEPTPTPVTPFDLRMTTSDGIPLLNGRRVTVVTPLTSISGSSPFGPLLDLNVTDGNVHFGILDLSADPSWQQGERRQIEGTVTHHEGRTVLTDVESVLLGSGQPVPPPLVAPIAAVLSNAEQLEGRRITFRDCQLLDSAQWPESPKDIAIARVQDPSGAQIDLEILAPPEHVDGLAPLGAFHATGVLLQKDPDGSPFHSGYRLRLELIEASGTSEVIKADDVTLPSISIHPNPASQATWIAYQIPNEASTRLRVLDAQGRRVRSLAASETPGTHATSWDLRDDRGSRVPAGIYFVHLASGDFHQTRKVTVTR